MERRLMIKVFLGLGAMAFMPSIRTAEKQVNNRLHFVGLGSAGTTAMVQCKKAGFNCSYSCITGPYVSHLIGDMEHHFFVPTQDMRRSLYYNENFDERITLTPEMKSVFISKDIYIIFIGLGSCTGTGLISSVLEMLLSENKNYVAICSLPFVNEGRVRNEYAKKKKSELEKLKNVFFFDHNQILKDHKYLNERGIGEAFAKGDEYFYSVFDNQALPIVEHMKFIDRVK